MLPVFTDKRFKKHIFPVQFITTEANILYTVHSHIPENEHNATQMFKGKASDTKKTHCILKKVVHLKEQLSEIFSSAKTRANKKMQC
ncbi:hypothetical protein FKM82_022053 [Ascaphus truei]